MKKYQQLVLYDINFTFINYVNINQLYKGK